MMLGRGACGSISMENPTERHLNSSRTRPTPTVRSATGSGDSRRVAEGRYVGLQGDLIGQATVEARGNKIGIAYRAPYATKDGKTHDLDFKETFVFKHQGSPIIGSLRRFCIFRSVKRI